MDKRFTVGETVIALTNPKDKNSQPREKGKKYKVLAVSYCSTCGTQAINIAGYHSEESGFVICSCGCRKADNGLWWTKSIHFTRPQDINQELELAVSEERYEDAAMLRDINNG